MKMTFRWYGSESDNITLKQIRQIPGMTGLMGLLDYKAAGEVWEEDEIKAYVDEVHAAGLECEVIESVNVHEDIKLGRPTRDQYIENYRITIRNLAKYGVKVIVYNFMPVLDWLRTDLARVIEEDGSNSLYFDEKDLGEMTPLEIVRKTADSSNGFSLPGWEPERLAELESTLEAYKSVTPDILRENYKYFLDGIIPTCEEVGIRMAVHPDDPAWHCRPPRQPRERHLPLHRIPRIQPGERHSFHHPSFRRDGPDRLPACAEREVSGISPLPRGRSSVMYGRSGSLRDHEGCLRHLPRHLHPAGSRPHDLGRSGPAGLRPL